MTKNFGFTEEPGKLPGDIYSLRAYLKNNLDREYDCKAYRTCPGHFYLLEKHQMQILVAYEHLFLDEIFYKTSEWFEKFQRELYKATGIKYSIIDKCELIGHPEYILTGREILEILDLIGQQYFDQE